MTFAQLAGNRVKPIMIASLRSRYRSHQMIAVLVGMLFISAAIAYWRLFEASQDELRTTTLEQADYRAMQLADALSDQTGLMLGSSDLALRELRDGWVFNKTNFEATLRSVRATFPNNALIHVAVIGTDGYVLFSASISRFIKRAEVTCCTSARRSTVVYRRIGLSWSRARFCGMARLPV
jgi:hypothetical protein